MKRIESFCIDHNKLVRGIYISRKDNVGNEIITTIDIRMKEPNREPVLGGAELHSIEHIGATFLRNHKKWNDKIIYFGPMGCCTGNYLLLKGNYRSKEVTGIIKEMFEYISTFDASIPGSSTEECGNYHNNNLPMARYESKKFIDEVLTHIQAENLEYPSEQ